MSHSIKKLKPYPSEEINWNVNAYVSMSMNNSVFHNKDLLKITIIELSKHTSTITIIVGDYLHRLNEQIFHGRDEKESVNIALSKGKELIDILNGVLGSIDNIDCRVIHSNDFYKMAAFQGKIERFEAINHSNILFHNLVEYTIDVFLRRQSEIKIDIEKARALCRLYLFEELAIFEILAEEGYILNIYPGNQLPIIKSIVTGELKGVSEPLEKIQAVEIKYRPK